LKSLPEIFKERKINPLQSHQPNFEHCVCRIEVVAYHRKNEREWGVPYITFALSRGTPWIDSQIIEQELTHIYLKYSQFLLDLN
jgi:hypothetical protein